MGLVIESPWWFCGLFIFLVLLSLRALKPRVLPVYRIFLIPGILTLWNIIFLAERLKNHYFFWIFWIIGVAIGNYIGWQTVCHWHVIADHEKKEITLPGTVSTLILVLLIFIVRYFFIFQYEFHPQFYEHVARGDSLSSGIIIGIFIGRSLELYRKYGEQR